MIFLKRKTVYLLTPRSPSLQSREWVCKSLLYPIEKGFRDELKNNFCYWQLVEVFLSLIK